MLKVNDYVSVYGCGNDTFKVRRIKGDDVLVQGYKGATRTVHILDCIKKKITITQY